MADAKSETTHPPPETDLPLTMNGSENGGGGGGDSEVGGEHGAGAANSLLSPKAPPSDCSDRSDTKSDARSGTASPNTSKTGEEARRKVRPSNGEADPGGSRPVPARNDYSTWRARAEMSQSMDASMLDPAKLKEREERIRSAKENQVKERQRKLEELRESQRRAQEFREKQQEERRLKLQDMRKREDEHRAFVERRRHQLLQEESDRRNAILKKAEEREAKIDQARSSRRGASGPFGFGSATPRMVCDKIDVSKRAASQGNLLRSTEATPGAGIAEGSRPHRRAVSACSLNRKPPSAGKNGTDTSTSPSSMSKVSMKGLSASTSQLSPRRRTQDSVSPAKSTTRLSTPHTNNSLSPARGMAGSTTALSPARANKAAGLRAAVSTSQRASPPPTMRRPRSSQSDHTQSSAGDGSPVRKPRPHSIAGRLPSYAAPTFSSQARLGRNTDKKLTATSLTPPKNRSKSAETGMRHGRSQQDIQRTIDRLSAPKTLPKELKDSPKPGGTPPRPSPSKPTPPKLHTPTGTRSVPKDLPVNTRPITPGAPTKGVTPTKGPVKAFPPVDVLKQQAKSPSPKAASPAKEKAPPLAKPSPARSAPPKPSPSKERAPSPAKVKSPSRERPPTPKDNKSPTKDIAAKAPSPPPLKEKAEAKGGQVEDEYKAKLAAKRREAREKAEREAEEKRLADVEATRIEEERIRQEEEEERVRMEEEQRMVQEARKAEEERLQKAIEEADRVREEEAAKAEQERQEKEEAEQRAREEAERREQERLEKARKEEEERLERKKKLDMIMSRVKNKDGEKSDNSLSPSRSNQSPPGLSSPEEPEAPTDITSNVINAAANNLMTQSCPNSASLSASSSASSLSASMTQSSQFKSPLLQQMLGNRLKKREGDSSGSGEESPEKEGPDSGREDNSESAPAMGSPTKSASTAGSSPSESPAAPSSPAKQAVATEEEVSSGAADVVAVTEAAEVAAVAADVTETEQVAEPVDEAMDEKDEAAKSDSEPSEAAPEEDDKMKAMVKEYVGTVVDGANEQLLDETSLGKGESENEEVASIKDEFALENEAAVPPLELAADQVTLEVSDKIEEDLPSDGSQASAASSRSTSSAKFKSPLLQRMMEKEGRGSAVAAMKELRSSGSSTQSSANSSPQHAPVNSSPEDTPRVAPAEMIPAGQLSSPEDSPMHAAAVPSTESPREETLSAEGSPVHAPVSGEDKQKSSDEASPRDESPREQNSSPKQSPHHDIAQMTDFSRDEHKMSSPEDSPRHEFIAKDAALAVELTPEASPRPGFEEEHSSEASPREDIQESVEATPEASPRPAFEDEHSSEASPREDIQESVEATPEASPRPAFEDEHSSEASPREDIQESVEATPEASPRPAFEDEHSSEASPREDIQESVEATPEASPRPAFEDEHSSEASPREDIQESVEATPEASPRPAFAEESVEATPEPSPRPQFEAESTDVSAEPSPRPEFEDEASSVEPSPRFEDSPREDSPREDIPESLDATSEASPRPQYQEETSSPEDSPHHEVKAPSSPEDSPRHAPTGVASSPDMSPHHEVSSSSEHPPATAVSDSASSAEQSPDHAVHKPLLDEGEMTLQVDTADMTSRMVPTSEASRLLTPRSDEEYEASDEEGAPEPPTTSDLLGLGAAAPERPNGDLLGLDSSAEPEAVHYEEDYEEPDALDSSHSTQGSVIDMAGTPADGPAVGDLLQRTEDDRSPSPEETRPFPGSQDPMTMSLSADYHGQDLLATQAEDTNSANGPMGNHADLMSLNMSADFAAPAFGADSSADLVDLNAHAPVNGLTHTDMDLDSPATPDTRPGLEADFGGPLDNQPSKDAASLFNLDADLLNSNQPEQTSPFIAFEENTTHKQDNNMSEIISS